MLCFHLEHNQGIRGGAFLLTRRFALTASHCLPPRGQQTAVGDGDEDVLHLTATDGAFGLSATVAEIVGDLALLDIADFALNPAVGPHIPINLAPQKGDSWSAPYRPTVAHPELSGTISNPDLPFQCADGSNFPVLQLTPVTGLKDHSGYSGGPVLSGLQAETAGDLAGILIEQFIDVANNDLSADALFAIRLSVVHERFDSLIPVFASAHPPPHQKTVEDRLDELDLILSRAIDWRDRGLILDTDLAAIRSRTRDYIFDLGG